MQAVILAAGMGKRLKELKMEPSFELPIIADVAVACRVAT